MKVTIVIEQSKTDDVSVFTGYGIPENIKERIKKSVLTGMNISTDITILDEDITKFFTKSRSHQNVLSAFRQLGVKTPRDLEKFTLCQFMICRGFGPTARRVLENFMFKYDLNFNKEY